MELKLVNFIKANADWEEKLRRKPYNVIIKRTNGYVIFNYTLGGSDFGSDYEVLRECRGTILDEMNNYEPVCVPFFKFFNYGEPYAEEINWTKAQVYQKIDGSLIKFWLGRSGELQVSTNGMIDAKETNLVGPDGENHSFYDLVVEAIGLEGLASVKEYLVKNPDKQTIMCELVSPHNRIVVKYEETELFLLSVRNKRGIEELEILNSEELPFLKRPKRVNALNLPEVVALCGEIDPLKEEGFVVVDNDFHRVKVKSEEYVKMHHNLAAKNISTKKLVKIIKEGEVGEVLNYAPNLAERITKIYTALGRYERYLLSVYEKIRSEVQPIGSSVEAKEYAMIIKGYPGVDKGMLFKINHQEGVLTFENILQMNTECLLEIIEKYSE